VALDQQPQRFRIVAAESGRSLRKVIACRLQNMSAARAGAVVKAGGVYLNNVRIRVPSVRVAEGERVTVYEIAADIEAIDEHALKIVARGPDFVILDKPRGVAAFATRARVRGTLSEALIRLLTREGVRRPYVGVVYGVDADASGVVLFTIRGQDRKSVFTSFRAMPCKRIFRVLAVNVHADRDSWTCARALVTTRAGGVRLARSGERGHAATTEFRRLVSSKEAGLAVAADKTSVLEVELEAGSSEQIRAHAEALGLELVTDPAADPAIDFASCTPALHACSLEFSHPFTKEKVCARSELPVWARREHAGGPEGASG
jgi:23S rRNA pseudouridine1911/1915/1917 synthase